MTAQMAPAGLLLLVPRDVRSPQSDPRTAAAPIVPLPSRCNGWAYRLGPQATSAVLPLPPPTRGPQPGVLLSLPRRDRLSPSRVRSLVALTAALLCIPRCSQTAGSRQKARASAAFAGFLSALVHLRRPRSWQTCRDGF